MKLADESLGDESTAFSLLNQVTFSAKQRQPVRFGPPYQLCYGVIRIHATIWYLSLSTTLVPFASAMVFDWKFGYSAQIVMYYVAFSEVIAYLMLQQTFTSYSLPSAGT